MQLLQRMRAVKDDPGAVEECCFRLADDPLQLADVPPAQVAYEVLNSLRDYSDRPRLAAAACTVLKHLASERTSQAVLVRMGAIDRVTNSMSCHTDAADVQAAGLAFLAMVAAAAPAEPGAEGSREDIRHLLAHHGVASLAKGVLRTHSASDSVAASAASLLDVVAARPDLRRHVATHDTVAACAFALHRHARDLRAALPLMRTLCAVCLSHGAEEDGAVEEGPGIDPVELPRQALAALVRAAIRAVGAHAGSEDGAYAAMRDSGAAAGYGQASAAPLESAGAELIAAGIQLLAGLGSVSDEDTATAALVELARSGGCTTVARAAAATAATDAEIAMDATSLLSAVLHDASVSRVLAEGGDVDALQGLASAVATTVYAAKRGVSDGLGGDDGVIAELEEAAREVAATLAARQREARETTPTPAPAPASAPAPAPAPAPAQTPKRSGAAGQGAAASPGSSGAKEQGGASPPAPKPRTSPQPGAAAQHQRVRVVRRRRKKGVVRSADGTVRDVGDASALAEGDSTDGSDSPTGTAAAAAAVEEEEEGEGEEGRGTSAGEGHSSESPAVPSPSAPHTPSAQGGGWSAMLSPELEAASKRVAEVVAARGTQWSESSAGDAGAAGNGEEDRGARGHSPLVQSVSGSEGSEEVWEAEEEEEAGGGPTHGPSRGATASPERAPAQNGTGDDDSSDPGLSDLLAMSHQKLARRAASAHADAVRWRNAWRDATSEASSTTERLRGDAARQQAVAHKQGLRVRQLHSAYSRVRRELRDATAAHEETADKLRRVSSRTAAAEKEIARLSRELVLARERASQVEHVQMSAGSAAADLHETIDRLQHERDSLRDALDAVKIEHRARLEDQEARVRAEGERSVQAQEAAAMAGEDAETALRELAAAHRMAATLATRVHVLEAALEEVHPMARPREVAARYPRRLKGMPYSPSHAARSAAARHRAQEEAWVAEQARSGGPAARVLSGSTDSGVGSDAGLGGTGGSGAVGGGTSGGSWAEDSVADALSRLRHSRRLAATPPRSPVSPTSRGRSRAGAPSERGADESAVVERGEGDDRVPGGDGATEVALHKASSPGDYGRRRRRPRSRSATPQRPRSHADSVRAGTPPHGRSEWEVSRSDVRANGSGEVGGVEAGHGRRPTPLDATASTLGARSWAESARVASTRSGPEWATGEVGRRLAAEQADEEDEEEKSAGEAINPVDAACGAIARDLARSFAPRRQASKSVRRRTQEQALGAAVEAVLQARSAFVATVLAQPSTRAAAQRAAQLPAPSPETAEEEAVVASGILPLSSVRNALWAHGVFSPPLEPRVFTTWVDDVWGRGCPTRSAGLADWIHLLLRAAQARHPRLPTMYQSLRFLVESHFPKLAHRALRWGTISQRVQHAAAASTATTAAAISTATPTASALSTTERSWPPKEPVTARSRAGRRTQRPRSAGPARPRPTGDAPAGMARHPVPDLRRSSPAAWQRLANRSADSLAGPTRSAGNDSSDYGRMATEAAPPAPRGSPPQRTPQRTPQQQAQQPSPAAPAAGGASDMADVEQMLDREQRALQDLFLSYCATGEGEEAEGAADELRRGTSDGMPIHALPVPQFVHLARDFRIVPTLVSKARLLKLCGEVVSQEEGARPLWGQPRPRVEAGKLTFPQFLFALGKIALTEIPVAEGAETPAEQMVALLRWMDESRGKEKLACIMGLPQVQPFCCSDPGDGV